MADAKGRKRSAFGVDISEGPSLEELEQAFGDGAEESPPEPVPAPTETPEGEQPPAEPQEPEPQGEGENVEEVPPPGEEAHAEEPTAEEGEARKWAAKFDSPEDLERSYMSLQAMETRTRQQMLEQQARMQQLEAALGQALPMIQENDALRTQLAQQRQGEGAQEFDTLDPQAMQAYIQREIQNGIQAYVQQQQQQPYYAPNGNGQQFVPGQPQVDPQMQQAWDASFAQRRDAAVAEFRRRHPTVTEGSVYDEEIARIVGAYNLDPTDIEQLEMGWDMWEDPSAGALLRANPQWLATPEGRALFRQNVRSAAPKGAPANGGAPARQPDPRTHVETGGTGAPVQAAPGERPSDKDPVTGKPRDEYSDVLDEWFKVQKDRSGAAFGLS